MPQFNSARAMAEYEEKQKLKELEDRQKEWNSPTVQMLNQTIKEIQQTNEQLQKQNDLLQEQLNNAKKDAELATVEAKKAKKYSWITFGVATSISIASLAIAILSWILG